MIHNLRFWPDPDRARTVSDKTGFTSTNPLDRREKENKRDASVAGSRNSVGPVEAIAPLADEASTRGLAGALIPDPNAAGSVMQLCMTAETVKTICKDPIVSPAKIDVMQPASM